MNDKANAFPAADGRLSPEQAAEVAGLRAQATPTRRATVPALEEILYEPLPVLDHGFIRVVDYMGDDAAIVQAARVSYGKGTKQVSNDGGLINYLMRNRHTSPFEMCELKLHVKLPIFIARQWIRHRTANVNEYSARYSEMADVRYLPAPEAVARQSQDNKQGRAAPLPLARALEIIDDIKAAGDRAHELYGRLIDEKGDHLAKETARIALPLSTYSEWYWKCDLHNILHFLRLRNHGHAQAEIRAYAEVMTDIVRRWAPLTARAFEEHRLNGAELSATALEVVRRRLAGEDVRQETSGLSPGEWRELQAVLGRR